MDNRKLDASAPWIEHYRKIDALFMLDEDVEVAYDDDTRTVTIHVKGADKADAFEQKIRHEVEFGNVTLHVRVVPSNDEPSEEDYIHNMFAGNDLLSGTATEDVYGGTVTYALFQPTVLQYWADNIGSPYGVKTVTAEQVAKDVLDLDAYITSDLKAE